MTKTLDIAELRGLVERLGLPWRPAPADIGLEYVLDHRGGIIAEPGDGEAADFAAAVNALPTLLDRSDALTAAEAQIAELRAALETASFQLGMYRASLKAHLS